MTPSALRLFDKKIDDARRNGLSSVKVAPNELAAIVAMARRALELEECLAYTEGHLRPVRCLLPDELLSDARAAGWKPSV